MLFDDDDIGARNRKVVDVNVRCHIVAARKTQVGWRREKKQLMSEFCSAGKKLGFFLGHKQNISV